MDQNNTPRIGITGMQGARAELFEDVARSLLNELNDHRRGTAAFAPAPPSMPGTKDVFGMSVEILLAGGGVASAWIVPAVQHWLGGQGADTGVSFTLKNDIGEEYVVKIGPNAPPEVVAKLSSALVRALKA